MFMATITSGSKFQQQLRLVVQSLQWTYGVYWRLCSQQGVLVWGDGCYNGAIKTRKTVQPMEVSKEEMSVQRTQQLRELYKFLSAGPETSQPPARRPCTALSPEDLTELEWFYLMCVSFSFPPGVGLPGKALAEQQHVWITGADQADSKFFPRAILAKNAGIQTVLCIPFSEGVLELGNTNKVDEDMGLIHHVSSLFIDEELDLINQMLQQKQPKPELSDHSTSVESTAQPLFHSPALVDQFGSTQDELLIDDNEVGCGSDDETDCGDSREEEESGDVTDQYNAVAVEPSELMQMEISSEEYTRLIGSSDDFSIAANADDHHVTNDHHRSPLPDKLGSAIPHSSDLQKEDAHYSWTVSMILRDNRNPWTDFCSDVFLTSSQNSAFSGWNTRRGTVLPSKASSQKLLKNVLFAVPLLHKKNGDGDGDGDQMFRRRTAQEILSGSHVMAERRRREKLNERFITLRSLVPFVTKMDKASILSDAIEYVKQLKRHIQELESQAKLHVNTGSSHTDTTKLSSGKCRSTEENKRKYSTMVNTEGRSSTTGSTRSATQGTATSNFKLQVSIIEADALLELQCPYGEGLLLMIMQKLHELQLEVTSVRSMSRDGILVADLRAKVREDRHGRKASIDEVKKAIHKVLS